ncbi:MAG: polyprenyl synthetase family protein [Chlamydiales bacterium]|nr:polyprenyl synthetase family protein [Chlamydiales bacterium]
MPLVSLTLIETINEHLKSLVSSQTIHPYEGVRYALFSGGKRFRPLLTIAVCKDHNTPIEKALDAACAIEMMHTFSLIHDDLPCMDDDDFRRGKPTLHKVIPEGQALLCGDLLQNLASETILASPHYTDKEKCALLTTLTRAVHFMMRGQARDLHADVTALSWDELRAIHLDKTAAMCQAALVCGGIIADADCALLSQIGEELGLAYQLFDDVADNDCLTLGKDKTLALASEHKSAALKLSQDMPTVQQLISHVK